MTIHNPCELPPCAPCPPPPYPPCPQVCPTPGAGQQQQGGLPPQPCRGKPIMRGLHWAQTKSNLAQAIMFSVLGGASVYIFLCRPRRKAYADFYNKGEFEDWADEMARKGHFQSVPAESLSDNPKK